MDLNRDWAWLLREKLLPHLEDAAGFRIDARMRLYIDVWLIEAEKLQWLGPGPELARAGLRSIICKSVQEQQLFNDTFDDWVNHVDATVDSSTVPVEGVQGKNGDNDSGSGRHLPENKDIKVQIWPHARILLALALTYLALLLYATSSQWQSVDPSGPITPVPAPAPASAPAASEPAASQVPMGIEVDKASFIVIAATPESRPEAPFQFLGLSPWLWALFLIFVGLPTIVMQEARRKFVGRISTPENLREQEVFARTLVKVSGARRLILRASARAMRRPAASGVRELDLLATARASAAKAGMFEPVWRVRHTVPSYLVLVDCVQSLDQQAQLATAMARDLAAEGVALDLYVFDRDPRRLWPLHLGRSGAPVSLTFDGAPVSLDALAARQNNQGLILVGEGDGLIDYRSGRLATWVAESFSAWPRRALMTPRPIGNWGAQEDELASESAGHDRSSFLLVPAHVNSMTAVSAWLRDGKLRTIEVPSGTPWMLPGTLLEDPGRWLSSVAPPRGELLEMIDDLRTMLGSTVYGWLAASAAYPFLSADLMLVVAEGMGEASTNALANSAPAAASDTRPPDSLLLEARLMALAQLPWSRQGYMPDWVRRALLLSLPTEVRIRVREVWESIFSKAGDAKDQGGKLALGKVTTGERAAEPGLPWLDRFRRALHLSAITEGEPPNSPLRDVIYLGVLRGDLDRELSLDATDAFADAVGARWGQRLSWNPWRWGRAVVELGRLALEDARAKSRVKPKKVKVTANVTESGQDSAAMKVSTAGAVGFYLLCESGDETDAVKQLREMIEVRTGKGVSAFPFRTDLDQSWYKFLVDGLEDVSCVIAIIGKNAVDSRFFRQEVERVQSLRKQILFVVQPKLSMDDLPQELELVRRQQNIVLTEDNVDDCVAEILSVAERLGDDGSIVTGSSQVKADSK